MYQYLNKEEKAKRCLRASLLLNVIPLRICTPVGVEEEHFPVVMTEANKVRVMLSTGLDMSGSVVLQQLGAVLKSEVHVATKGHMEVWS